MGVSDRHLRRIFEAELGVSPIQYLQTRRLLTAKQLLADTDLPITQVALISGFASVRRVTASFTEHYSLHPTQLRREGRGSTQAGGPGIAVRLGYRKELEAETDPAAQAALFETLLARMYAAGKAERVAEAIEIDAVIDPVDTRGFILRTLAGCGPAAPRVGKKRPFVDVW